MKSDCFDLVSSFDFIDHLATYTYFPLCLDCLPVCRAYTCGSELGFGCSSHCRHCHGDCGTVLRGIGQRYVSRVLFFFFLPFDLCLIVSCFSLDICSFLTFLREHIFNDLFFFDRADTLYLCYCIDKEMGERKREEVFIAVCFSTFSTLILESHFYIF